MSNSTQKPTLNALLKGIKGVDLQGNGEKTVGGITTDSRTAQTGDVFIPIRGTQTDGHNFIRQVLEKGVDMVVCETYPAEYAALFPEATFVTCPDTHEALGLIADAFYGHPSAQLKLVGVTGTNGKTTTATLLYETFRQMGYATGLISTVCNRIDGREEPTKHTTPDAITLNRLLREMLQAGCEYVFMEVSSHAVEQRRIAGVRFAGGIFTNLTRDHMDYHGNMANYLKAKKRFFDELPPEAFALTNADDKNGEVMTQNTRAAVHTYALHGVADFKAKLLEMHLDGMLLQMDKKEVSVQLTGAFNIYNLLSVYAAAVLLGAEKEEVQRIISTLKPVNGRLQTLHAPAGYTVIVDYAHTPDALVNVLETIAAVQRDKGQTITVVGAGGDRDRGKRPIMAQECSKRSHVLILTSDNPRSENPDEIISEMMQGLTAEQQKQTLCITDRRTAIKTACLMAKPGDVVLIAGKGHETYQEIKGVRHHFDDREEALSAMK